MYENTVVIGNFDRGIWIRLTVDNVWSPIYPTRFDVLENRGKLIRNHGLFLVLRLSLGYFQDCRCGNDPRRKKLYWLAEPNKISTNQWRWPRMSDSIFKCLREQTDGMQKYNICLFLANSGCNTRLLLIHAWPFLFVSHNTIPCRRKILQ